MVKHLWLAGLLSVVCGPLHAQDQTINGNLTVTGSIEAAGSIDSGDNTLTFGTQGSGFGGALLHQDSNSDTFTFLSNRNPASWLWQHSVGIAAMRLDANHQLILYQADGTTAGVTLAPASNSIKLGTHSNGTLTADANGVITAGGGFSVTGGITNTNGSLTGGASGLTLNAGGTNQNISISPSGSGVIYLNGRVGIGTSSPTNWGTGPSLEVDASGGGIVGFKHNGASIGYIFGEADKFSINGRFANPITFFTNGTERVRIDSFGNVGIGTTTPAARLHVVGNSITSDTQIGQFDAPGSTAGVSYVTFGSGFVGWDYSSGGIALNAHSAGGSGGGLFVKRVDNSRSNVGIGTTSPAYRFQVQKVGTAPALMIGGASPGSPRIQTYGLDADGNAWMGLGADMGGGPYEHSLYFPSAGPGKLTIGDFNGTTYNTRMTVSATGNVGIGTTSPQSQLHVVGGIRLGDGVQSGVLANGVQVRRAAADCVNYVSFINELTVTHYIGSGGAGRRQDLFFTNDASGNYIFNTGNVGIGTTSPTHKLAVKGTIRAEEVIVDTGWADYVFEEDYRLASLAEVEEHIREKKHLPGIPSAAEVAEHGVSMGDMQSKLLSKVEELTLHLISQEKRLNEQAARLAALEQENQKLQTQSTNP